MAKDSVATPAYGRHKTVYFILTSVAVCHLLNDMMSSSLLPSVFPLFKTLLHLSFTQIGLLALTYQLTASLLQPLVGHYTDHHPMPFSLPVGLASTLIGLLLLSVASSFYAVVFAAALAGVGSSVFHPESSRVARMASGGQYGLAQSLFQVGGNVGQAGAPLLIAFVALSRGQTSIAWFALIALLTIMLLIPVSFWYRARLTPKTGTEPVVASKSPVSSAKVRWSIAILVALLFSKNFYQASIGNYLIFYLIDRFQLSGQAAQIYLFCLPGRRCSRHVHWRACRRPDWSQVRHLGFHSRRVTLHNTPAPRRPVLDYHPHDHHRRGARIGLLGDYRLCPGASSRKSRHDLRSLLWPRLRVERL